MKPARSNPSPEVRSYNVASGQTAIVLGSVVILSAGELAIAGVNPTGIVGIALQAQDSAPGYQAANSPVVSTYRANSVSVAIANANTEFIGQLTSTATVQTAAVTHIGDEYGITKQSAGHWTVDVAKLGGDARVVITAVDLQRNLVYFKFLESAIA